MELIQPVQAGAHVCFEKLLVFVIFDDDGCKKRENELKGMYEHQSNPMTKRVNQFTPTGQSENSLNQNQHELKNEEPRIEEQETHRQEEQ